MLNNRRLRQTWTKIDNPVARMQRMMYSRLSLWEDRLDSLQGRCHGHTSGNYMVIQPEEKKSKKSRSWNTKNNNVWPCALGLLYAGAP